MVFLKIVIKNKEENIIMLDVSVKGEMAIIMLLAITKRNKN